MKTTSQLSVFAICLCAIVVASCQTTNRTSSSAASASQAVYSGGDGTTIKSAVLINLTSEGDAVASEYSWLREHFPGCTLKSQALIENGQRHYDGMTIALPNGSERTYYFDISKSFGSLLKSLGN
jgi:hypothetical protein